MLEKDAEVLFHQQFRAILKHLAVDLDAGHHRGLVSRRPGRIGTLHLFLAKLFHDGFAFRMQQQQPGAQIGNGLLHQFRLFALNLDFQLLSMRIQLDFVNPWRKRWVCVRRNHEAHSPDQTQYAIVQ
ncbi:MAG: hypothetical protein ABSH20_19975 [Tepidisphaeraceae bacterium]